MHTGLSSKLPLLALMALWVSGALAISPKTGVLGYWKEPQGSVIHVETCGKDVCATIVAISPSAPERVDEKNRNPSLRHRSLCGLHIGNGFHLTSPVKAEGGLLYDPKSGKTYHGVMTAHGDKMALRGYVGVALFGRTKHWTRADTAATCSAN